MEIDGLTDQFHAAKCESETSLLARQILILVPHLKVAGFEVTGDTERGFMSRSSNLRAGRPKFSFGLVGAAWPLRLIAAVR
jgi:hypothetical protein